MIDLGTIAGLHEHDHQLAAYCSRCDAWRKCILRGMHEYRSRRRCVGIYMGWFISTEHGGVP
jgi:hypothetical protein